MNIIRGSILKSESGAIFVVKRVVRKDDDLDRLVLISFRHGVTLSAIYTTDDLKRGRLIPTGRIIADVSTWLRKFSSDHPANRPAADIIAAPASTKSRPT